MQAVASFSLGCETSVFELELSWCAFLSFLKILILKENSCPRLVTHCENHAILTKCICVAASVETLLRFSKHVPSFFDVPQHQYQAQRLAPDPCLFSEIW